MNKNHLQFICTELQLGLPDGLVTSVNGCCEGSFMWRVNTDKGSYAIKQFASMLDLKSERIINKYELSETIAYRFAQQGIQAVSAIQKSGKHLIITENTGYLVYPWVEGYILGRNEIFETHAIKIAEVIAKLHNINLNPNHIHAAFYSSIGSMVFWMLYNIEIACTNHATGARDTAIKEINGAMSGNDTI